MFSTSLQRKEIRDTWCKNPQKMGDFRWNASMFRAVIFFPEMGGRPPKAVLCILKAVKAYILPGQYIFLS